MPGPSSAADRKYAWPDIVGFANAQPNSHFSRQCQPNLGVCVMAIAFPAADGTMHSVRVITDAADHPVMRDMCKFNVAGDIRECLNYDTQQVQRDMKDGNGNWQPLGQGR